MDIYEYRFSSTVPKENFRNLLIRDLEDLGLVPTNVNDTVTVSGEASFETCMGYMARFFHFPSQEFYLSRKG